MYSSQAQVSGITTRQSLRKFGINLTNQPLATLDNTSKPKRSSIAINNSADLWLRMHPQIAPYFKQITERNKITQNSSYIADNYMKWHSDISVPMRQLLVGWLISLQSKMNLSPSTLYLAVNIVDKYCYQRFISRDKYQLLGLTSLFIAAKYEEIKTPRLKRYVEAVIDMYGEHEILAMEGEILILLGFNLKVMTVVECLQQQMGFLGFDEQSKKWCRYVLDLTLLQYWSCLLKPSVLVWAVVTMAAQKRGIWIEDRVDQMEGRDALKLISITYSRREEPKFKEINGKHHQQLRRGI